MVDITSVHLSRYEMEGDGRRTVIIGAVVSGIARIADLQIPFETSLTPTEHTMFDALMKAVATRITTETHDRLREAVAAEVQA